MRAVQAVLSGDAGLSPGMQFRLLERVTGHRPFAVRTFGASHSRPDMPSPEEVKTGE